MPGCSLCGLSVEWSRSCYAGSWRLFGDDPNVTTDGRYYFSPLGTPFYSGSHYYVSRNWNDSNHHALQGLGEDLTARHTWDDGSLPAELPRNALVGNASCFADGEQFAHGVDYNDLDNGFNPTCFVPLPALAPLWDQVSSFDLCSLQFFYSTVISWLYYGQFSNVVSAFNLLLGPGATVTTSPVVGIYPSFAIAKTPDFAIMVAAGTNDYQQFALQGFYSLVGPVDQGPYSTNPIWQACSQWFHQALVNAGVSPSDPLFLCGHSYGAVALDVLAARYRFWNPTRVIRMLTFGAPKVGDTRMLTLLDQIPSWSVCNDGDLVTVLPPNLAQIAPLAVALALPSLFLLDRWLREPHRQLQFATGALVPNGDTVIDFPTLLDYTNRALAHLPIANIIYHEIGIYRDRILTRCPNRQWPLSLALFNLLKSVTLPSFFGNDFFGPDFFGDDYYP